MNAESGPILILTNDVHIWESNVRELPAQIEKTLETLSQLNLRVTFFVPAPPGFLERMGEDLRRIVSMGHEIGSHGLTHDENDLYDRLPFMTQMAHLRESKERLEAVLGRPVTSFRAPAFRLNGNTIRALDELGFFVDASVNSRRLGLLSSDPWNLGWLYAPSIPYHPSYESPFRKGQSKLWEIPQSAFLLPFISNTSIAFPRFMRFFSRLILLEGGIRKIPVVYMFHVEEMDAEREPFRYKFRFSHLLPHRHGIPMRAIAYSNKNPRKIRDDILSLFKLMKSIAGVEFRTISEQASFLNATGQEQKRQNRYLSMG